MGMTCHDMHRAGRVLGYAGYDIRTIAGDRVAAGGEKEELGK